MDEQDHPAAVEWRARRDEFLARGDTPENRALLDLRLNAFVSKTLETDPSLARHQADWLGEQRRAFFRDLDRVDDTCPCCGLSPTEIERRLDALEMLFHQGPQDEDPEDF